MSRKIWVYYLLGGGMALLLYFAGMPTQWNGNLFIAFGIISLTAMLIGLRGYHPYPLLAWSLIVASQFFNELGDFLFTYFRADHLQTLSKMDFSIFYILGMVSLLSALVILYIQFRQLIGREAFIHGLIVATAFTTVIGMIYFSPQPGQIQNWQAGVSHAGFAIELAVVGVITSVFLMSQIGHSRSFRLIYLSMIFTVPGLYFYNAQTIDITQTALFGGFPVTVWYNFTYSLAYLLLGAAFLHPSIESFRTSLPEKETTISKTDLFILGGSFWTIVLTFFVRSLQNMNTNIPLVIVGMLIIFSLVVLRLAQIVKKLEVQNRALSHQQIQLHYQVNHDMLTDLPNRNYLYSFLEKAVEASKFDDGCGAVFMIDLNRFKQINDTYGHDQGDLVLQEIASKMLQLKRKGDIVARWGGDEFVFVLGGLKDAQDALGFARRLTEEVHATVTQAGKTVTITLSIGVGLFSPVSRDIETILKHADIALYQAKRMNGENIFLYQTFEKPKMSR